ncbi:M48 family metallopeptidase [Streptomyces sp. NPDC001902]
MGAVWASLRALLAIVLLAGLVVLIGGLGLGVLGLLGLFLLAARDGHADLAMRGVIVAAAAVPLLLSIVQGLGAITRAPPLRADAVPVSREEAPALWELATGIAWQVGARPPDVLLLTGDANASVSEDGAALGLLSGQRRLHLGLPLLASLTHAELRAVLAHEFGHFSHRHTRFGAVAYRCDAALATTLGQWNTGTRWFSLPHLVMRGSVRLYALVFRWLTFAVRRRQELEADRTAARLAGREVTASALRATHGTAVAWRRFQQEWLDPAALVGMHPDNPYLAFRSLLGELGVRRVPVDDDRVRPHRRDSHPPLGLRLRRLRELDVPPGEDDGSGALRLLPGDVGRVLGELRGPLAHSRTTVPWERWIKLSANRVAGTRAWDLLRAASRATGERLPGLDTVLRLLADDGPGALARESTAPARSWRSRCTRWWATPCFGRGGPPGSPCGAGAPAWCATAWPTTGCACSSRRRSPSRPNLTGCASTSHSWTWTPTARDRPIRRIRGWRRDRATRRSRPSRDGGSRPWWTPTRSSRGSTRPASGS